MTSIAWEYLQPIQIAQILKCRPDLRDEYEKKKKDKDFVFVQIKEER